MQIYYDISNLFIYDVSDVLHLPSSCNSGFKNIYVRNTWPIQKYISF